jgi:hypothetical protein
MMKRVSVLLVTVLLATTAARAAVISEWAGTGANTACVTVNFADGADYTFGVRFDGTTTGLSAVQALDAQTGLDVVFQDFGWGMFVDGFSYDGHSNIGYAGDENWWHYWIANDGQNWTSPFFGAGDRVLADGNWDGWVYGTASAPAVPEPVSLLLLAIGGAVMARGRKGQGWNVAGLTGLLGGRTSR